MSNFSKLVVTKAGISLINENLTTENKIIFTRMAASDHSYSFKELEELQEMEDIKQYTVIRKTERTDEGIITVDALFDNRSDELTESYFVRTIGLFATAGDSEILFAAAVELTEHPAYVLSANTTVTSIQIKFKIKLDNAENIEITVNTAGMATIGDVINVSDNLKEHADNEIVHVTEDDKNVWNNTLNDAKSYSDSTYRQATGYADNKIAELIGGAPETLDTLKEVADAIEENKSIVDALDAAVGKKANKTEFDSHADNEVIHITSNERTNWNDANLKKHAHENKSLLDSITSVVIEKWNNAVSHISDMVRHISAEEREYWNTIANKADVNHTHNYAGSATPGGEATSALKAETANYIKGDSSEENISVGLANVSVYDSFAVFSGNKIRCLKKTDFVSSLPTYSTISLMSGYLMSGNAYPFGSGVTCNTITSDLSSDNLRGKTILGGFITFEDLTDTARQYISGYVDVISGECIRAIINNKSENAINTKIKYTILLGDGIRTH